MTLPLGYSPSNTPANTDLDAIVADIVTLQGAASVVPGGGRTVTQLGTYLANNAVFNVKDYNAKGDEVADDTAAFQAAGNAATAARGVLYIPQGAYLISGAGAQCLLYQGTMGGIVGEGWGSRIIVASGVGGSTDAIRIQGASGSGFFAEHFTIEPQSGTPGRYGLNIDVSAAIFDYATFSHLRFGKFGNYSVACVNTPPNVDGFFTSRFVDCLIEGGISFNQAGDTLALQHCTVTGPRDVYVNLVYSGGDSAHGFVCEDCNVTSDGGIHVVSGNSTRIIGLNAEQPNMSTGTNSALIDLDGTVSTPLENVTIEGGFLGGTTGNCLSTVRVNYCIAANIRVNRTVPPGVLPTYAAYRITSHAIATNIIHEQIVPYGVLLENLIDDQGVGTTIDWVSPVGTNPRYLGHKGGKSTTILHQAGGSQTSGSVIFGVIPSALPNVTVTVGVAGALMGATSVPVNALSGFIPVGTVLTFASTHTAQLSGQALPGATSLSVVALGAALTGGDTATYAGGGAYGDLGSVGLVRVMGNGNIIVGNGTDVGSLLQVNGAVFVVGNVTMVGDVQLTGTHVISGKDSAGTASAILNLSNVDNVVRVGAQTALASNGHLLLYADGVEKARLLTGGELVIGATTGTGGSTKLTVTGDVKIASGNALQLGSTYSAGVVAATGTVTIKDSTGTVYNVLVHT